MSYKKFLDSKKTVDVDTGISSDVDINGMLFDFQRDIVQWAVKRGRAAIFADCGLGKTPMQLEWARLIHGHTNGKVLIVAPLAVSTQTVNEGVKFGVEVNHANEPTDIVAGINITNYEKLHKFNPSDFTGLVLDESSILKSYTGKYRNNLIENWTVVPFRLACSATPAPNDFMELGNHAEFIGAMSRTEMLSMFFIHDGGETQKWRLKGHGGSEFWKWLCSWAVMIRKPSDLGYDDGKFTLPELRIHEIKTSVDMSEPHGGMLFRMPASTLQERQKERAMTISERVKACSDLVEENDDASWLIWCNLNSESDAIKKSISGCVEVKGSDKPEHKEKSLMGFSIGTVRKLVSKPSIAGWGMNWQHCNKIAFVGLSDSYEQFYQAVRRCWRFGQTKPVDCYIITAETEGAVVANIKRKEKDSDTMAKEMVKHMHVYNEENIKGMKRTASTYQEKEIYGDKWTAYLGDSCEVSKKIESDSVGYSVFSPPFASLYTYSNSDRDMGNCKTNDEFLEHFGKYLVPELFRVTQRGRLVSFHCMNLPTSKNRDGFIGIRDFRGQLIKIFEDAGFIFHSEVCIWKDPVTAMQRTKALGLLHKQICKDSCLSRQGIPDYFVTMRKPGDNENPVKGELDWFSGDPETFQNTGNLSIDIWQRYASPVWSDIRPNRTLQYRAARENNDERHICPLQLDVIERGVQLWSNPSDLVFSPFMGIASEGHVALNLGRRFLGIELKESYYRQACKNLVAAEIESKSGMLDL